MKVVWVPPTPTQFLLHDLDPTVTYTFKVRRERERESKKDTI